MSITTRKFSEFVAASLNNTNKKVGLSAGVNAIFDDVTSWTTATRPTTPTNGLLGYNTDLQSYEFFDTVAGTWTQLEDSTDIATLLALLASNTAGEGASLIGLEGSGTVQQFTELPFYISTPSALAPNAIVFDPDDYLPLSGGTMAGTINMDSNTIENLPSPLLDSEPATKGYVDAIAFNVHPACNYATTANLNAVYSNGTAGLGATLTNNGALAAFTADGQTPALNDRILIPNQTNQFENGIYVVTTVGDGATAWVLTRADDYNQASDMEAGDKVTILAGDTLAGHPFVMTQTATIVVGTTDITWLDTFAKFGTMALQDADSVAITGGTIDDTIIGGTTPAAGTFTALESDTLDINGTTQLDGFIDDDTFATASATTGATSESIKNFVDNEIANLSSLYGYINLTVANDADADHDISITQGQATDSTNTEMITLTTAGFYKRIDANWSAGTANGGFPSGLTLSNNTWYHFFLIKNPTTGDVDAGWDTSLSATNLLADATGYTLFRRIASQLTDGLANILPFRQLNDRFYWLTPIADINGSITTSTANYTLSTPLGINCIALCNILASLASNNPSVYIRSTAQVDQAPSTSIGTSPQTTWRHTTASTTMGGLVEVPTDTSSQFAARSNVAGANFGVVTLGYRDWRGQNNQ